MGTCGSFEANDCFVHRVRSVVELLVNTRSRKGLAHLFQLEASLAGRGSKSDIASLICNRMAGILRTHSAIDNYIGNELIPVAW